MFYHSPQFQNIADKAAIFARPLILAQIKELSADFRAQFPEVTRIKDHFGTPQIVTKTYIPIEADQKNQYTTPFTMFLLDVAIPFTITLQPELLIDGVPIEEAIQKATQKTFVVVSCLLDDAGDFKTTVLHAGQDEAKARQIFHESGETEAATEWQEWQDGENTRNEYM